MIARVSWPSTGMAMTSFLFHASPRRAPVGDGLMDTGTTVPGVERGEDPRPRPAEGRRGRPLAPLVLPAWCGLVAGLLEVSTIVLRKQVIGANRFYGMSRHFAWL